MARVHKIEIGMGYHKMELNFECVRACIMAVEAQQTLSSSGKPDPLDVKRMYGNELIKDYSRDDIHLAFFYLVEKKLVCLGPGKSPATLTPRNYSIHGITAQGYDYLAAVRDNAVWKKVLKALGKTALASVPNVIGVAAQILAGLL